MNAIREQYIREGVTLDSVHDEMRIDLCTQRKIRIVGVDVNGREREYFLKVTERRGLVLI